MSRPTLYFVKESFPEPYTHFSVAFKNPNHLFSIGIFSERCDISKRKARRIIKQLERDGKVEVYRTWRP